MAAKLAQMSHEDLKKLAVQSIDYKEYVGCGLERFGCTLSDGQTASVGSYDRAVPLTKDLCKIETIFSESENFLQFLSFHSRDGTVVTIGKQDHTRPPGRKETFDIGPKERLLGVEIHH